VNNDLIFLVEMGLVFGLVMAWAVWELISLNREERRDAEKRRDED